MGGSKINRRDIQGAFLNLRKFFYLFLFSLFFSTPLMAATIYRIEIDGDIISPPVAEFLTDAINQVEREGGNCLIIHLDTPGGLDTSMRQIIKAILNSAVPIVVYVAPSGARAASAGAIITLSAHIAAMAPGTNIGAAHPVNLGGKPPKEMVEKIVNDMVAYVKSIAKKRNRNTVIAEKMVRKSISLTAEEAVKKKIVDFMAGSFSELLQKLDGRKVKTTLGEVTLNTKGAEVKYIKGGLRYNILRILGNPNIAYVLMMIGLAGLYFELSHPGAILPGVVGAICLVLAFFAFQTLPVDYAGVLLIILGIIFFILELKITSYGLLTIAAIFCYALGSVMLFHRAPKYLQVSFKVLIPTLVFVSLSFIGILTLVMKAQRARIRMGIEALVGEEGEVIESIPEGGTGKVFIHGEYWNAESDEPIAKGEKVSVIGVEKLKLKVKKIGGKDVL